MTNFLDIAEEFSSAEDSRVHIIPVPYDATSTYRKGADLGPAAMIAASSQVEWFDIETETEPHLQGIHTQPPVICTSNEPADLSPMVGERVGAVLDAGGLPVVLGGEHSVSIGAILATSQRYPDLTVLQIDAHGDTRESYHGSTHNHACVMARAREVAGIVQVGIRAIDQSEWDAIEPGRTFFAHEILDSSDDAWMMDAIKRCTGHVYLTFDLDAFDPSVLPATGTPEPGGLDWRTVNAFIRRVARERTIVGFDVVELCPHEAHHASDFTAAKLVHRLISECLAASDGRG